MSGTAAQLLKWGRGGGGGRGEGLTSDSKCGGGEEGGAENTFSVAL